MKKFAVFDIDGTIFRWQLFHEIVFELIENGHIPTEAKALIDEKMKQWRDRAHPQAFREYDHTVWTAFRGSIAGLTVDVIETAADKVITRSGAEVYRYTRDLIEELREQGYTLIALSASQNEIVQHFAKRWGFDIALGQVYTTQDGIYTGTIPGPIQLYDSKGILLKKIVKDNKLSWKDSVAVGDSHSDAQMLALVERPIAFNPDAHLFEDAKEHGWPIVVERKNMVYKLEPHGSSYILA